MGQPRTETKRSRNKVGIEGEGRERGVTSWCRWYGGGVAFAAWMTPDPTAIVWLYLEEAEATKEVRICSTVDWGGLSAMRSVGWMERTGIQQTYTLSNSSSLTLFRNDSSPPQSDRPSLLPVRGREWGPANLLPNALCSVRPSIHLHACRRWSLSPLLFMGSFLPH